MLNAIREMRETYINTVGYPPKVINLDSDQAIELMWEADEAVEFKNGVPIKALGIPLQVAA